MSVRSGQSITVDFTTRDSTGALANADSLPAGTLVVNGTDNAASVTVTNKATGRYKAAVTLPALAVGDVVQLYVAATVGGVGDGDVIWEDSKDVLLDGSGKTTDAVQTGDSFARIGAAGAGLTALGDARLANLDVPLSLIASYIDTEVAAIKAKTDNLPADPAGMAALATTHGAGSWATATAVTVSDKTGFKLAGDGLDAVAVESGLNARQAFSVVASACAGVLSGAATSSIIIKGAGVTTTRVQATVDPDGNRPAVTLTPPA
jgi:hypothetical protein